MGVRFLEKGREWGLPCYLYTDDLALMWRVGIRPEGDDGRFVEVCRKLDLKVNEYKRKAMVLGGEE